MISVVMMNTCSCISVTPRSERPMAPRAGSTVEPSSVVTMSGLPRSNASTNSSDATGEIPCPMRVYDALVVSDQILCDRYVLGEAESMGHLPVVRGVPAAPGFVSGVARQQAAHPHDRQLVMHRVELVGPRSDPVYRRAGLADVAARPPP